MAVEVYSSLDAIPARTAEKLSVRSGVPFFKSMEWFRCLSDHGMEQQNVRIYIDQTHRESLCALFFCQQQRRLSALSNFYTIEYGPVMSGTDALTSLHSILLFMESERPRHLTIDMRNLQDEDRNSLSEALTAAGFTPRPWAQYKNWFLNVAGLSFEQYYAKRSSQLRNTIERKTKKAQREHELRIEIYPSANIELDDAINHFETVYRKSWKEAEPYPDFMSALIRCCDQHDMARIGLAWVDGEPAAAQFWIRDHDRAIIYKLAYDQKFSALSIGSLLSKTLFQHLIDIDRVAEIDYGIGDESYKRDWMDQCRQLSGILACNRSTIRGQLVSFREYIASWKARH
ncbi:MAG: GNAT family N-acetyltransferase [Gammaproteobacteria bacterium]|nr:GNAT family N-acetyltransferase [Gammaproteobacteria bacterium]